MAKRPFLVDIDLNKNQLLQAKLENLITTDANNLGLGINDSGYVYWDTVLLSARIWTGTGWKATDSGGSVNNSLILKADSGTTEDTDLYTFNGSSAKTLNIVAGTNITISKSAGQWTINGPATGVTSLSFGTTGLTPNTSTTGGITVAGTLVVSNGGTGVTTLTSNGILYGNGTGAIQATAAGTQYQVLQAGASGIPTFGALALNQAAAITGILPLANGGTGTSTGSITGTGALTFTAGGTNTNIVLVPNGTGSVNVSSKTIINVATPVNATDAANKSYVDALKQGLDYKDSARVATVGTETFTITGGAVTGITGLTVDGVTLALNDRILIKNAPAASGVGSTTNTTQPANGIYYVTGNTTNLTVARATDADSSAKVTGGMFVFVNEGTSNSDNGYVLTTNDTITLNTTALTFTQFSGAGQITAGTGLSKSGNTLSLATAYGDSTNPYGSKTANYVLASPDGSAGVPTFRALVANDLPAIPVSKGGTGYTTGVIARKVTGTIPSTASHSVAHGFGQAIVAQVWETTSGTQVEVQVVTTTASSGTTTFTFQTAPTASFYSYTIIG